MFAIGDLDVQYIVAMGGDGTAETWFWSIEDVHILIVCCRNTKCEIFFLSIYIVVLYFGIYI